MIMSLKSLPGTHLCLPYHFYLGTALWYSTFQAPSTVVLFILSLLPKLGRFQDEVSWRLWQKTTHSKTFAQPDITFSLNLSPYASPHSPSPSHPPYPKIPTKGLEHFGDPGDSWDHTRPFQLVWRKNVMLNFWWIKGGMEIKQAILGCAPIRTEGNWGCWESLIPNRVAQDERC